MLDYAVTQNQKHVPSRFRIICLTVSCLAHFLFFFLLVEFPQLLEAGYYNQFHGVQRNVEEEDAKNWRTVAILENPKRMEMPSAETLKKILNPEKKGSGAPPIRINLGNLAAALAKLPPLPAKETPSVQAEAKPSPQPANQGNAPQDSSGDKGAGSAASAQKPEPKVEIATNVAPSKIPDSIKPPPPVAPSAESNNKTTADTVKVSQASGIGLFDTKGFPLEEYKDFIVDRVKANWFIPSNVKGSQRQTTFTFRINKEGKCYELHIASSSGNASLDFNGLNAISKSDPFPPLPKGFPGNSIGVKLILLVEP
jgi:outer membrane biosynthesis protein TonB